MTEAPRGRRAGLRQWTIAHPAAAFVIIVFTVGYPLLALVIMAWRGMLPGRTQLEQLPVGPDQFAALLVTGAALLPAAAVVTWTAEGAVGLRCLASRATRWRIGARGWVLVLGAIPAGTILWALGAGGTLRDVDLARLLLAQSAALLVNLVAVTLWEEIAWAGVLQNRLAHRHHSIVAGLLAAVPFALLHWPFVLLDDATTVRSAAAALVLFVVLSSVLRTLLGVVADATRASLLAVAVQHAVFNRTTNADGVAATAVAGDGYQIGVVVTAVVVTLVLAASAGRTPTPSAEPRQRAAELDTAA